MKFTDKSVARILATNKREEISDGSGLNLICRVGAKVAKGEPAKTYYWRGRVPSGEIKRIPIGRTDLISSSKARDVAREYTNQVRNGQDPHELWRKAAAVTAPVEVMTVSVAWEHYTKAKCARHRSLHTMKQCFVREVEPAIGAIEITQVTDDELGALLARLTAVAKNKGLAAHKIMNPFFAWASAASQGRSITGLRTNQMLHVGKPSANYKPRTRKLNEREIAALLKACYQLRTQKRFERQDKRHAPTRELVAVRRWAAGIEVLLRTGQRSSEILDMVESELDWTTATFTIPAERFKTGVEHALPLPPQVMELLKVVERPDQSERIFQRLGARSRNLALIVAKTSEIMGAPVKFSPHDLRRTFATFMQEAWDEASDRPLVDEVEIEATLGHTTKGVKRHYNQSQLMRSKGRVLMAWNKYLDSLVQPTPMPVD